MKKIISFLFCLIVNTFLVSQPFLNLDFESKHTYKKAPTNWFVGGTGYNVQLDSTAKYSGKYSIKMIDEGANKNFGVCTGSFPIEYVRGKKIIFTGWVKTKEVKNGYAGLWWRVDGDEKQMLGFDNMNNRGITGNTEWKKVSIEMKVDIKVTNINYGALFTGEGTAWFDNFEVFIEGKKYEGKPEKSDFESYEAPSIEYLNLINKADSFLKIKDYKKSAASYTSAFKSMKWKGQPIDRYNAACAWAMSENPDSAFDYLDRILKKRSFTDYSRITTEKYFEPLYKDKRWPPLIDLINLFKTHELPLGWSADGTKPNSYIMGLEKGVGQEGKNAVSIISIEKELNETDFGKLTQKFKADKYLGKRVRFSGNMKTKDVKGWAGFSLRMEEGSSSKVISYDNMHDSKEDRSLKGSNDWKKCEIVLDVPINSNSIAIAAFLVGNGQIWFDDLKFEIVDLSIPTTGKEKSYQTEPINLDFNK